MNKQLLMIPLLMLSACSSKPISMNYYILHHPGQSSTQTITDYSAYKTIWLRTLESPDYLKQRSLSIQTSPSEIKFATQHVWAEPLPGDFATALSETLFHQHNVSLKVQSKWTNTQDAEYILDIRLTDFIPTYDGNVMLKGSYQMVRSGSEPKLIKFSYQLPLSQNGFSHSVIKMRELINLLASEIVSNVETIE